MTSKHHPRRLEAKWHKKEKDFNVTFPDSISDLRLLSSTFYDVQDRGHGRGKTSFIGELERRGYDISTLKFSVELLPPAPPPVAVMATCGPVGVDGDGREA